MKTLIICLAAAVAVPSHAAILAAYDFNDGNGSPTSSESGVTADAFVPHGGLNNVARPVIYGNSGGNGWIGAPSSEAVGSGTVVGTPEASIAANDYFSFRVSPASGFALSLTQLKFSTAFYSGGTFNLTGWYFVRSSRDNYTTTIGGTSFPETHVNSLNPTFNEHILDLSGVAYQDLTSDVTFRIYLYDNSNSETRWLAVDNVILEGTVTTIPETSGLAFLLPGLALLARKRR
ncbi:MAG: hypothetical protein KF712_13455 [Akkermansiaceae bacterium]|nr:hypothetical protein [Akkermansiaceae bacterium]